jgi:DNA-binding NtrC family response regulator
MIREQDLPPYLGGPRPGSSRRVSAGTPGAIDLSRYANKSLKEFRDDVENEFIKLKLVEYDWNISRAAQSLGIERTNLHKKLRSLNIQKGPGGDDDK